MMRKVLMSFALLCILASVCFTVYANEGECSFALSDVNVKTGRLFTSTLSIKSQEKIASFVGEISFDENTVEYREVKIKDGSSVVSVNTKEKGELTFVYLCEDGVVCSNKADILTFTFKAKNVGSGKLSLAVRDVIDSSGSDISVTLCEGSQVTVTGTDTFEDETVQSSTALSDNAEEQNFTKVEGSSVNIYLVGLIAAAVVVALITVAYISYKIGVRKHKKSSDREEKERVENEKKT